jgi:[protein-PII] uridylyltransferase
MGLAFGLQDTPAKRASEQVMQLYFRAAKTVSQLNGILLPNLRAGCIRKCRASPRT